MDAGNEVDRGPYAQVVDGEDAENRSREALVKPDDELVGGLDALARLEVV
jgi:hypothetical protein